MNISYILVFLQFLSLGLLFMPWYTLHTGGTIVYTLVCFFLSFALLVWTSRHNRLGNFNIVPEIKEHCLLIRTGPYRYIRHPMYTSVVLIGAGALIYAFSLWKAGVLLLLILVLYLKARREENLWCKKTEEYSAYRESSKMFLPFIL